MLLWRLLPFSCLLCLAAHRRNPGRSLAGHYFSGNRCHLCHVGSRGSQDCCLSRHALSGHDVHLRCLHSPSGALARTVVLSGPAIKAAGFGFVIWPVGVSSLLMLGAALPFNNLTGRRYPHLAKPALINRHQTVDQTGRGAFKASRTRYGSGNTARNPYREWLSNRAGGSGHPESA